MELTLPLNLKPMLALTADPFDSDAFLFEPKWDGFRCLAYVQAHVTRLQSRNGVDLSGYFPELSHLHRQISVTPAILDGEIIVFRKGKELFHELLQRIRSRVRTAIGPGDVPALFVAFDILYSQGESILHLPLGERKELLQQVISINEYIIANGYVHQWGLALFDAAVAQGREGIMAKKLDSPYLPGKRTRLWLKMKPLRTIEAVVIGYVEKADKTYPSLALGQYLLENNQLIYVGNVGTGFTEDSIREIIRDLTPLFYTEKPEVNRIPRNLPSITWVEPEVVVELRYLEYTPSGNLRHPTFRRRRDDIEPRQCIFQGNSTRG